MEIVRIGMVVEEPIERKPVAVDMWYDRSRREWVIYPVDKEGTQLAEARYGFSKAEDKQIREDILKDIADGVRDGYYY